MAKRSEHRQILDHVAAVMLILATVFGSLSFLGWKLMGVAVTIQRLVIPLLVVYYAYCRFFVDGKGFRGFSKIFIVFMAVMAVWVLYGLVQIALSPWVVTKEGIKELIILIYGALNVYCFYEVCRNQYIFRTMVQTMRLSLCVLLLLATFEFITGYHLPTSRFSDPAFLNSEYVLENYGENTVWYLATGIFYNQNDLCMVIGLLTPSLFTGRTARRSEKVVCFLLLIFTIVTVVINDSWIVFFSIVVGLIGYLIFSRASVKYTLSTLVGTVVAQAYLAKWMSKVYAYLGEKLPFVHGPVGAPQPSPIPTGAPIITPSPGASTPSPGVKIPSGNMNIGEAIMHQFAGYGQSAGSLYNRLICYLDSLKTVIATKGLGTGPASYANYFSQNPSASHMVNPHNWWLEVLTQYGVFVFVAYVGVLSWAYVKLVKKCLKTRNGDFAVVASMCTTFAFVCLAPSSMIGFPILWMPIGLCLAILNWKTEENKRGEGSENAAACDA